MCKTINMEAYVLVLDKWFFFWHSYMSQFNLTKRHQLGPGVCFIKSPRTTNLWVVVKKQEAQHLDKCPLLCFPFVSVSLFVCSAWTNLFVSISIRQLALLFLGCVRSFHQTYHSSVFLVLLYLGLALPWARGWDETSEKHSLEGASLTPDWFLSMARWECTKLKHKHFFRCSVWLGKES